MAILSLPDILTEIRNKRLETIKYRNFLAALRMRRERTMVTAARPIELTIDVTTRCQLRCPHCATGRGEVRKTANLTTTLHGHLCRELAETALSCPTSAMGSRSSTRTLLR